MLEQIQTSAATEATSSAAQKSGKTGKSGVFANLFSTLTHKKGHAGKSIATGSLEKETAIQTLHTLQAGLKANKVSKAHQGKVAKNGQLSSNTKITALQTAHLHAGQLISQNSEPEKGNKKKEHGEDTQAGIIQTFKNTESETLASAKALDKKNNSERYVKNNTQNGLTDAKNTAQMNLNENESKVQTGRIDSKQVDATLTVANDRSDPNSSPINTKINNTNATEFQTPLAQTDESTTQASVSLNAAKNKLLSASTLQDAKAQDSKPQPRSQLDGTSTNDNNITELASATGNKTKPDAQANLAQQSSSASRTARDIAKSGHAQPVSGTPSSHAANTPSGHASMFSILSQNSGQSSLGQNGQSGKNPDGQLAGSAGNVPLTDKIADQNSSDSRFAGIMQGENRSIHGYDANQQLHARPTHAFKAMQAMQHIAMSAKDGVTRIELQLEPAHLGKVHVSLQTDAAKQLQVHLTVEHAMSRQVIEQHIPQLRAALEQQGLSLDNFTLQTGSQQQHAAQQNSSGWSDNRHPQQGDELSASAPSGTPIQTQTASHGRLSIHA